MSRVSSQTSIVSSAHAEVEVAPRLSAAEEWALARAVQAGLRAVERLKAAAKPESRSALEAQAAAGRAAEARFVEANEGLVRSRATMRHYHGVQLEDLMQAGRIGLLEAVRRFDPAHGTRFSTYAVPWIDGALLQAVTETGHSVRLTRHANALRTRYYRTRERLRQTHEREPTPAAIAAAAGLDRADLVWLVHWDRPADSLDRSLDENGDLTLGDRVIDVKVVTPEAALVTRDAHAALHAAVESLGDPFADVVRLRFGLAGHATPLSVAETAARLGLKAREVNRLEARALFQLRRFLRSEVA